MSNFPNSRIRVIYVLRPCALGFSLRSVRDIYSLKMALGCFSIFIVGYCFSVATKLLDTKADALYILILIMLLLFISCCMFFKSSSRVLKIYL